MWTAHGRTPTLSDERRVISSRGTTYARVENQLACGREPALGGERITPRTAHNVRCRRQVDVADGAALGRCIRGSSGCSSLPKAAFRRASRLVAGANVGRARGLGAGWGARGDAMASAIDGSVLKPLVAISKDDGPRLTVTVSGTSPHWSPRPQQARPLAAACLALVSGRPRASTPSRPDGPRRYVQRGSPASGCRCARDP